MTKINSDIKYITKAKEVKSKSKKEDKNKMNKNFYVLTIADDLIYFETKKEAENYVKNFPKGTYKIGNA